MINPTRAPISIPITQAAEQYAVQFACEQPTPAKAQQVYLNTLAVCAVDNYLRMLEIPTELTAGDSWNPVIRLTADVADLWITGVGRLECRVIPMNANQQVYPIPAGIQDERIGYAVVQIDSAQRNALILGFLPNTSENIVLTALQPIHNLLIHVDRRSPQSVGFIHLSRWWQDVIETGWQAVENVLPTVLPSPAFAFRRQTAPQIERAKLFQLANRTVALVVTLTQLENTVGFGIAVQVIPEQVNAQLPAGLTLKILDEAGTTFFEAIANDCCSYLTVAQFQGQRHEHFEVQLTLNAAHVTECFQI